jgi:riboflavin synthase
MFTGIIEALGRVIEVLPNKENKDFWIEAPFVSELTIDQSVAHNGVCLTVVDIKNSLYKVTAISETLNKTNLAELKPGDFINLERCLQLQSRLDGHLVQGHVDCVATCVIKEDKNGSWLFGFKYDPSINYITVPKGSICVNGVSLTVVDSQIGFFTVAIIPFTYEHTTFKILKVGQKVNLEFDIIGKYITQYAKFYINN